MLSPPLVGLPELPAGDTETRIELESLAVLLDRLAVATLVVEDPA